MSDPKNVLSGGAAFQYPILRRSLGHYQTTVSVWNSSTRLTRRLLKPR
jgi:hypothetical protein